MEKCCERLGRQSSKQQQAVEANTTPWIMKKIIANRINMYVVVLETCKRHEGEWAGIPKFVSAVNDLESALNEINAIALSHSTKTLGVSSYKTQKLKQLYARIDEIHGAYRALADDTGDPGLKIRNGYTVTTLRRMNAIALKTHISRVAEDLIETGDLLEPYGVDNTHIGEVLQLIEESKVIISKPRNAIVERKNLTANMDAKAAAIDRIVKERMDNMVRLFKRSLPEFFQEYFAARIIINSGVRHNNSTIDPNSWPNGSTPSEPDDGN